MKCYMRILRMKNHQKIPTGATASLKKSWQTEKIMHISFLNWQETKGNPDKVIKNPIKNLTQKPHKSTFYIYVYLNRYSGGILSLSTALCQQHDGVYANKTSWSVFLQLYRSWQSVEKTSPLRIWFWQACLNMVIGGLTTSAFCNRSNYQQ